MRVCEPFELAYPKAQTDREQEADQQAQEWGFAMLELAELVKRWGKAAIAHQITTLPDTSPAPNQAIAYSPTCEQCVSWRLRREITLSNGNKAQIGGFCETRAAADLEQMPKTYATRCRLFEEKIPF